MRDVTNSAPPSGEDKNASSKKSFAEINLEKMPNCVLDLWHFIKAPIRAIQSLPQWNWKEIFFVQGALSALSGFLAGVFSINFFHIIYGLFLMPILAFIATGLLAAFFYYYFQVFEGRTVEYRRLMILVILANVPFYLFQVVSHVFPPASLLGFAFSALLIIVGLTDNFSLQKERSIRLVGVLSMLVFAIWLWNYIDLAKYRS